MVKILCLLALDFLVDFGGGKPTNLVAHVFDFGPRQGFGGTLWTILFVADELRQLIQLCQYCWRPSIPTRFDFRCHDLSFLDSVI